MRGRTRLRVLRRSFSGWGRGLFVIGVHRSGTSAATRALNMLGIPLGDAHDLIEADQRSNPTGHWESARLTAFNDRLLAHLGGTWWAPPRLVPGWEAEAQLAGFRSEALRLFASVYGGGQWAWKDPRNCLTLPYWRRLLRGRTAAVVVVRHPLEIAGSMAARDGFTVEHGVALWERYMRSALAAVEGMPVLVTTYDDLLQEPEAWTATAAAYLRSEGFGVADALPGDAAGFVDPGLRHASLGWNELAAHTGASPARLVLYRELLRLVGRHRTLPRVELPPETSVTEELLEARRQVAARS